MFNVELKFTVDSIKFWFDRNKKVLELVKIKNMNICRTINQKIVAFTIFQWKAELLEGGLTIFAEQNIYF